MSDSMTTIPVPVDPEALRREARERLLLKRTRAPRMPLADDRPTLPVVVKPKPTRKGG